MSRARIEGPCSCPYSPKNPVHIFRLYNLKTTPPSIWHLIDFASKVAPPPPIGHDCSDTMWMAKYHFFAIIALAIGSGGSRKQVPDQAQPGPSSSDGSLVVAHMASLPSRARHCQSHLPHCSEISTPHPEHSGIHPSL